MGPKSSNSYGPCSMSFRRCNVVPTRALGPGRFPAMERGGRILFSCSGKLSGGDGNLSRGPGDQSCKPPPRPGSCHRSHRNCQMIFRSGVPLGSFRGLSGLFQRFSLSGDNFPRKHWVTCTVPRVPQPPLLARMPLRAMSNPDHRRAHGNLLGSWRAEGQ